MQQQPESAANLLHCNTPFCTLQQQHLALRTHDSSLYVTALQRFAPLFTPLRSCSSTWRAPPARCTATYPSTSCSSSTCACTVALYKSDFYAFQCNCPASVHTLSHFSGRAAAPARAPPTRSTATHPSTCCSSSTCACTVTLLSLSV